MGKCLGKPETRYDGYRTFVIGAFLMFGSSVGNAAAAIGAFVIAAAAISSVWDKLSTGEKVLAVLALAAHWRPRRPLQYSIPAGAVFGAGCNRISFGGTCHPLSLW